MTAAARRRVPSAAMAPIAVFRHVPVLRPAGAHAPVPPLVSVSAEALCRDSGGVRRHRRPPRAERLASAATGRVPWTL